VAGAGNGTARDAAAHHDRGASRRADSDLRRDHVARRRALGGRLANVRLRLSAPADLGFITALERDPSNRELIGQWSDAEHLAAIAGEGGREHWIIERDGTPAGYLIAYDCRGSGVGVYVKRILVQDKERGTGRAALSRFIEKAFARDGATRVWLIVRDDNARAQGLYRSLGFVRFDPEDETALYDAAAEPPGKGCFRMRLLRPRG
jgi:ribosomal protein S18 acetylase RimI-like enzyme